MAYHIKDWRKFQHFKDRRPPWIKLYRELLDDPEWHGLEPSAAKMLVMLWLIGSEADGALPDIKKLAFRLRLPQREVEKHLNHLSHWLIQDDINVISRRYQSVSVGEGDKEGEGEGETETDKTKQQACAREEGKVNGNAVAYIPVVGGSEFGITADYIKELETAYPAVDGIATLKEIRAWCVSNPTRCKTKNGVTRFINAWFQREQNAYGLSKK